MDRRVYYSMQKNMFIVTYESVERMVNGSPKHSGFIRVEAEHPDNMLRYLYRHLGKDKPYKVLEVQHIP